MSPRPKRFRKISNPPIISGFKPYGHKRVEGKTDGIFLYFEEYEALRLCDFELLNHHQAAMVMDVSRPTLTRIYASARQKIAEAMVLGKQIVIEGGKIYYDSDWYSCSSCGCYFNNPEKNLDVTECPLCHSMEISEYSEGFGEMELESIKKEDICICPSCGYEQAHQYGRPCRREFCPQCHHRMVRKGTL